MTLERARTMLRQPDALLLDIRTPDEHARVHFGGAILVPTPLPPLNQYHIRRLRRRLSNVVGADPHRPIVIYCKKGIRSRKAAELLHQMRYKNVLDLGGIMNEPLLGLIHRDEPL